MKLSFALLAGVLVSSTCLVATRGDLIEDVNRFLVLIPTDEVAALHDLFHDTDPAFEETDNFIHGPRMTELVLQLDAIPEFGAYFDFLESKNIPGYTWLNMFRTYMGWPQYPVPPRHRATRSIQHQARDFSDFITAVLNVLPVNDFITVWDDLMANSPEFKDMVALVSDPEYRAVRDALTTNPTYVIIDNEMISNGFDLTQILTDTWIFFKTAYENQH